MILVYPALGWPAASPMPGRTLLLLAVVVWFAASSGRGLSRIGLGRPVPALADFGLAVLIVGVNVLALTPIKDAVRDGIGAPRADLGVLHHVHGDPAVFAGWLAIAWSAAAFGEEIVFRGYLQTRVAGLLGGGGAAWATAIVVQAGLFGAGHAYQGAGVVVTTFVSGLFSGALFLALRRNLWPLILAHGIWDTLGLWLIYLRGAPST